MQLTPYHGQPLTATGTFLAVRTGHLPPEVGVNRQRRTVCVLGVREAEEVPSRTRT